MKLVNGTIIGTDININSKDDVWQPVASVFHCSLMLAYPKVFFNHCTFNNPRAVLNVTRLEDEGTNQQNRALQIIDPGEIDPAEWVIISNQLFDFCAVPVKLYGRNCEIVWQAPAFPDDRKLTRSEWRVLEDLSYPIASPSRQVRRQLGHVH